MAESVVKKCWLDSVPTEIIVRILFILDTYQIITMRSVNKKIKGIVDKYVFNNKLSIDGAWDKRLREEYFPKFWMSVVKPIEFLQGNEIKFNDILGKHEESSTQHEDANPNSYRSHISWIIKNKINKYLKHSCFETAIAKTHSLYFDNALSFLILHRISDEIFFYYNCQVFK